MVNGRWYMVKNKHKTQMTKHKRQMKRCESEKLRKIKVFGLDVDGVLTDGNFLLWDKKFVRSLNTQDGLALCLLHYAGLQTVVISGQILEPELKKRLKNLYVTKIYEKVTDKVKTFFAFLQQKEIAWSETCYIGDDLPDLPLLKKVCWAVSPANGCAEVKKTAHFLCQKTGGSGALREATEFLLKRSGKWEKIIQNYLPGLPPEQ